MSPAVSLSIALQMDPVGSIDITGDTSFALGLEAQSRGHTLWYYSPDRLSLNEGRVEAIGQALTCAMSKVTILMRAAWNGGRCLTLMSS